MAINRDPAEWFQRRDRWEDVEYGVLQAKNEWVVLKKHWIGSVPKVSEVARVDSRKAAIGFIKLLREN